MQACLHVLVLNKCIQCTCYYTWLNILYDAHVRRVSKLQSLHILFEQGTRTFAKRLVYTGLVFSSFALIY